MALGRGDNGWTICWSCGHCTTDGLGSISRSGVGALDAGTGVACQEHAQRRIEAVHRAGDAAEAHRLATEYLHRYPNNRRHARVRRYLKPEAEQ